MNNTTLPLGIFSWFGFKLPLPERLALIREAGFDTTALWWGETEKGELPMDDLPALVRDSGLFLENIHVPFDGCNDFWSDDASIRRQAIDAHLRWIDD